MVFAEQGYDQASMRAIALAAGVSIGGVYLYFKSKEELYLTLMTEWMDELEDLTSSALAELTDPGEAILAFIRVAVDFAASRKDLIHLQRRDHACSTGIDIKQSFFRARRARIAAIIHAGIETGRFRECDAEEAAKVIFTIVRGYIMSMIVDEEALFAPEACADLVLNGLVRRNEQ